MPKAQFSFTAQEETFRRQQLDTAGLKRYAASGNVVPWEPVLNASTPPSGYNSALTPDANRLRGYYIRHNDKFEAWFSLQCGASFNEGVGGWSMELPSGITLGDTNGEMLYAALGEWRALDNNTLLMAMGTVEISSSTEVKFMYPDTNTIGLIKQLGAAQPWTWATSDQFGGHFCFPIL